MKKIFAVFAVVALLFSACSEKQAGISPDELSSAVSSGSEGESVSVVASEAPSEPSFEVSSGPSDRDETCAGAANECLEHHALYHAVNGRVIDYVGCEALEEWRETLPAERDVFNRNYMDAFSIQAFIKHFDIPKDIFTELERGGLTADFLAEFDGITVCSLDQIDAFYSGDPAKVNKAFCGELAFVYEGQLRSIYELAETDDLSGLPRDEIEALLSRTEGYPENVQAMAAEIRFDLQRLEYIS